MVEVPRVVAMVEARKLGPGDDGSDHAPVYTWIHIEIVGSRTARRRRGWATDYAFCRVTHSFRLDQYLSRYLLSAWVFKCY
jgi:hypothetical protein